MSESGLDLAAILLAGGRASRVAGEVKPLFEVAGISLLHRAVAAASAAGAEPVTVAGPVLDPDLAVTWVREDPPFSGPAAGIIAALQSWPVPREWALILACDLPWADLVVSHLTSALPQVLAQNPSSAGVCLLDEDQAPQWLAGVYRTRLLLEASAVLPDAARHHSVRSLLASLPLNYITAPAQVTQDVDSWADLARARATWASTNPEPKEDEVSHE